MQVRNSFLTAILLPPFKHGEHFYKITLTQYQQRKFTADTDSIEPVKHPFKSNLDSLSIH